MVDNLKKWIGVIGVLPTHHASPYYCSHRIHCIPSHPISFGSMKEPNINTKHQHQHHHITLSPKFPYLSISSLTNPPKKLKRTGGCNQYLLGLLHTNGMN